MGWFTKTRDRLKRSSSRNPPKLSTSSISSSEPSSSICPPLQPAATGRLQPSEDVRIQTPGDAASDLIAVQPNNEAQIESLRSSAKAQEGQEESFALGIVLGKEGCEDDSPQDEVEEEEKDHVIIKPLTRAETFTSIFEGTQGDQWTRAFTEALEGLDGAQRGVVMASNVLDIHELFAQLDNAETAHKQNSVIRRGMDRVRGPLTWLDAALSAATPLVAMEPAASTAFGIARGVTTLAIGICGIEARLSTHVKQMLDQITVIDDCDNVAQKFQSDAIHKALVAVYTDLLAFYCLATEMLTRQATVLALLSEQLRERLPPIVEDYVKDSKVLSQHIANATTALLTEIKEMVLNEHIRRLLGAENLNQALMQHAKISRSIADEACKWATGDDVFTRWVRGIGDASLATNGQMLSIFGTMGSGKTKTMAYLIGHIRDLYASQKSRILLAHHYCTSDETGRPLAVYSSIIQQLMNQKASLMVLFKAWDDDQKKKHKQNPTQDSSLLSQFLLLAVQSTHRPIFIFVDGLDECNDNDDGGVKHIIVLLRQCTEMSPHVRVCVSARNQQNLRSRLSDSLSISVPQGAKRDASIVTHIVRDRLDLLQPDRQQIVIDGLSEKAKGSAIWVRLAVDLLVESNIQAEAPLKRFIKEIPQSSIGELYGRLFAQIAGTQNQNAPMLSTALEILAVADRPMSIAEISWAVALVEEENQRGQCEVSSLSEEESESGEEVESGLCVADLEALVDSDRLLGILNPFIVSVGLDYKDLNARQIRLNHHSVREHVLHCPPQHWPELAANPELVRKRSQAKARYAELHGRLARQCVRYLLIDGLAELELFTQQNNNAQVFDELCGAGLMEDSLTEDDTAGLALEHVDGAVAEEFCNPADRGFGEFFVYASCYWLEHMHQAQIKVEGMTSRRPASSDSGYVAATNATTTTKTDLPICLADVLRLADRGSNSMPNWWIQLYRPDCTVKEDESRARPQFHDDLTLLSLYGSDSQLREAVRHQRATAVHRDDTVRRTGPLCNAIQEVLRIGNAKKLPLLLPYERGRDFQDTAGLFSKVLENWARDQRETPQPDKDEDGKYRSVFDHMLRAADLLVEQRWGNELLCIAAGYGCLPILRRLFDAAKQSEALRRELLRCPDRDSSAYDCPHQSVGMAVWNGHTAAVEYLLAQKGIQETHLRYRNRKRETVLHCARRLADARLMRLLCETLPDLINDRSVEGDTALQVLLFNHRPPELARILLEVGGADVRSGYEVCDWHEPLRMAARYNELEMCRTLIKRSGRHDLLWVVAVENEEIAKQLRGELGLE